MGQAWRPNAAPWPSASRPSPFGGTATHASERYAGQPDSAATWNATTRTYSCEVTDYAVFDLFAHYDFTPQARVRGNVGNVTKEDYYLAAYPSGAFLLAPVAAQRLPHPDGEPAARAPWR